jgi:hypothetical protein
MAEEGESTCWALGVVGCGKAKRNAKPIVRDSMVGSSPNRPSGLPPGRALQHRSREDRDEKT